MTQIYDDLIEMANKAIGQLAAAASMLYKQGHQELGGKLWDVACEASELMPGAAESAEGIDLSEVTDVMLPRLGFPDAPTTPHVAP